ATMTDKTLTRTSSQVAALCVVDLPHALYNSLLQVNVSTGTKKLVAAAAMGGVSLLLLARHFQRRRGKKKGGQSPQWEQMGAFEFSVLPVLQVVNQVYVVVNQVFSLPQVKSINSSLSCTCAIDSSCWDRPGDEDLCGVVNIPVTTPENLYLMGMELFEEALRRWEQALTFRGRTGDEEEAQWTSVKLGAGDAIAEEVVEDLISPDFVHKLEGLLQRAYRLQEEFEGALGIPGPSSHSNSLGSHDDLEEEVSCPRDSMSIASNDSFVSAAELAEQHRDQSHIQSSLCRHSFYDEALRLAEEGQVSCRVPRTELLECLGDTDFLAKLHCVRQACQLILCETTTRKFLAETGKKVLSSIILKACKVGRPKRFEEVFEEMIVFLEHQEHWQNTEVELATRGVKHLNFYDIVLDFILMDSFEDLENPPMSIQNVVNNRWLNASFKETAVASSCWSVLKQKRQHVKVPDGFIAHFYSICEQISPVLAWGFLGPKTSLHDFCCFFKDQVLSFLKDIFHLEKVCYYSVETLAEDILRLLHHRSELMLAYLGADSPCDASPPYSLTPPATPLLPTA
uniref:Mitoguardin 1 n=1 Tax=Esox lucius TaxID=8010 RepID=A0A3P8ZPN7_ESOLU